MTSYRIQLIHTVIETNERSEREVIDNAPLTARGLARIYKRWAEETNYIRRTFGPNVIRPKHRFFARIVREDDSVVTSKTLPVFEYDYDADGKATERIVGWDDQAIDPIEHISTDRSWGENADTIISLVHAWDARQANDAHTS